jgi:hypothetical protein
MTGLEAGRPTMTTAAFARISTMASDAPPWRSRRSRSEAHASATYEQQGFRVDTIALRERGRAQRASDAATRRTKPLIETA